MAPAAAAPSAQVRIVLIRTPGDERLTRRLRAELMALGWDVVEVDTGAPAPLREGPRGLAAIRASARDTLELWIDRGRGLYEAAPEPIPIQDLPSDEARAVRAAEVLRARLIELDLVEPPSAAPPEEPAEPSAPLPEPEPELDTEDERPVLWLWGAPALTASAGGFPATAHVMVGLRAEPIESWSAGVFAGVPLGDHALSVPQGSASMSLLMLGAAVEYFLVDEAWRLGVGSGGGIVLARVEGRAEPPFAGRSDSLTSSVWFGTVGLHRRIIEGVSARAEVLVGMAAPRLALRAAGEELAQWGRPFGIVSVGLEVAVPGLWVHRR